MTDLRTGISLTTLTLSIAAFASPVLGQEGPARGGVLSFSQGFVYDLEDGLETETDLSLNVSTSTRVEELEFGIGTQLYGDFTDGADDDFNFRNWFAALNYVRRGANSALNFGARYREVDLGDSSFEVSPGVIIIDEDGSLTSTVITAGVDTGIEGPFGLSVDAAYRERDYEGVTDPDLVDETGYSIDALARFSLTPSTSLRARAGIERTEEDDGSDTERETRYVGLGVATSNGRGLSFTADVLYDESEVTTSAPSSTTEDGIGVEMAVTQARPNGSIGATLTSRIDDTGRRTTAAVNRNLDLRNGALAFSLGIVDQEGVDDLQLIGDITYEAPTPRGAVSARLAQSAASSDGDTVVSTSLALAYRQEINSFSGWEAAFTYAATDELGSGDDEDRASASVAYTRNLTADWSMRTGYEYVRDDDGDESNSLFLTVERDITFGF